ncbi:PKD domain-containing protein [Cupriavidus sp. CuC1]|uniref:PKD domain-containing protein n=1 Tax=Cupriavidus sp. CuC1 TaxID=3373131 RepID=UPI0037CDC504
MSALHQAITGAVKRAGQSGAAGVPGRAWRALFQWALLSVSLLVTPPALAQAPAPGVDAQFDVLGYIQEATLDACGDALCGGKMRVNGHTIVIPSSTIVILPANSLTWKELFTQAPAPYTNVATGMALADSPAPISSYEAHVIGNQVGDVYIAGLVYISQQSLNSGTGFINYIDYASGEMRVGGRLVRDGSGVPQNVLDASKPGVRVRVNDPGGRFGRATSPDRRFTIDADNPTIRSVTGYPMCVPRVDASRQADDDACPQGNRPKDVSGQFASNFTMPDPASLAAGQLPDPRIMAPFEVGDHVTYSGTLVSDRGVQGPYTTTDSTYVSAHTLIANLGIFTAPFTDPAYVAIDVTILGNGGIIVPANMEAVVRTRFEGFTTDPSRNIHLYGVDVAPDGTTTDRDWGIVGVDPGAPTGTVKGRWRFRPPCTGLVATFNFCFGPLEENTFLPATREVRAVIEGAWTPASATPLKNGLVPGQYHAPILEYLFQESFPGVTPPPISFATIPFLAKGGYSSSSGVVAGPLKPWPGSSQPSSCTPPQASAGANITVQSGATKVQLNGTASGSGSLSYQWTPPKGIALAPSATVLNPTFNAPTVTATNTLLFALDVVGCDGQKATSAMTVTVTPAQAAVPFVNPVAPLTVPSGSTVVLTAVGTGAHKLSYSWTQTSGPPQPFNQPSGSASMTVSHALPVGQTANDVLGFTVIATDTVSNAKSAPVTAIVTFTPAPDTDTITVADYRIAKQRLDVTAVSSVVSPKVVLTLQPYRTTSGRLFDPATLGNTMTNNGGGNYTLALVGAPQPGPGEGLVVKSNLGGSSPPTQLTRIR